MSTEGVIVVQVLLASAALLLLIPVGVLFAEVLLAVTVASKPAAPEPGLRPRLAVLIPAHNEATVIGITLQSILSQLAAEDRVVVVADNCDDDTAAVARAAGAEVIVRTDTARRGKGFALDRGVQHLCADPPEVLIIVDADCGVAEGTLDRLARRCARTGRPIQALYEMQNAPGAGALRRLAQFAWTLRNEVRPRGLQRLGGPCQLMGSGMAFGWQKLGVGRLASGHLVEDLQLGIELAAGGAPPLFCPEAHITSVFPTSERGVSSQRTRWEHGHLAVLLHSGPRLLLQALRRRQPAVAALALDLMVPPLALLVLLVAGVWLASLALALRSVDETPLVLATLALALLIAAVFMAWARYGRRIVRFGELLLAVGYALAKLPLYARFVGARQREWVRSERGEEGKPPRP